MRNKKTSFLIATLIFALTVLGANATLINGGFETGDTTGWTISHPYLASVVTQYTSDLEKEYNPVEGDYFLILIAGAGANLYTIASQDIYLNAGEKLSGWAAFDAQDYLPFNDEARIMIKMMYNIILLWSRDVNDVGGYGDSDWGYWSFIAPFAGTYKLEYMVRNVGDNALNSVALFDATKVEKEGVIPEPGTLILIGSGILSGLIGYARIRISNKRKNA